MIFYHALRIIEIFVIVCAGFRLMTRTYKLRWKWVGAKILLTIALLAWCGVLIANSFITKYSYIEHIITFSYFFLILLIFYNNSFLYVITNCALYWINMLMIHTVLIYIGGSIIQSNFYDYIRKMNSWFVIDIIGIVLVISITLILLYLRREKSLISLNGKKDYLLLLCLLIIELICMDYILFDDSMLLEGKNAVISIMFMIISITFSIIYFIYISFTVEKHNLEMNLLELKCNLIESHYNYIQKSYDEKRIQLHDNLHQNMLLKEYLKLDNIEEACCYLDEIAGELIDKRKEFSSGISSIDLIINCKIDEAKMYGINIKTDMSVYFCPLERREICIVMGNLLDNAIEATKGLLEEQKNIYVRIKTINNMFFLEIENAYSGIRRKIEDKYLTTKQDNEIHGLGIESCKMLIINYGGTLNIEDNGEIFKVEITIYKG